MQILSYNPTDDTFFIGLSENEFEELAGKFGIDYGHLSNYEKAKEGAFRNWEDSISDQYKQMIKELYDIQKFPYIYVVINRSATHITIRSSHFPFANLWNAYSPWRKIKVQNINDIKHLEGIYVHITE
jgi:hypothetical protein